MDIFTGSNSHSSGSMAYPFVRQYDAMDCGPACISMIALSHGTRLSLETIRKRAWITREGVSFLGLRSAAESIGFRAAGVKIPFSKMKEILEIREEDIYGMKKGKVDIEEIHVPLINACSRFLAENPELKNITHPAGEVEDMFIKSKDREELLIYGKENIVKAFKLCKKEA